MPVDFIPLVHNVRISSFQYDLFHTYRGWSVETMLTSDLQLMKYSN